jgi:hypothetical protein
LPGQAEDAEPGAQVIAEHRRQLAVRGEVSEEARVLPVRQPGQDHALEVAEDGLEALRLDRRRRRQLRPDVARRNPRHHGQAGGALTIVGHPVDDLMAQAAEFLGGHA